MTLTNEQHAALAFIGRRDAFNGVTHYQVCTIAGHEVTCLQQLVSKGLIKQSIRNHSKISLKVTQYTITALGITELSQKK